jgi:hypothetical protein
MHPSQSSGTAKGLFQNFRMLAAFQNIYGQKLELKDCASTSHQSTLQHSLATMNCKQPGFIAFNNCQSRLKADCTDESTLVIGAIGKGCCSTSLSPMQQ